ncbi:MAG: hypothetical protein M3291_10805 [Actinomycetota bacterium]|nr:hypothetical protein [Actinomycetota bacterium]
MDLSVEEQLLQEVRTRTRQIDSRYTVGPRLPNVPNVPTSPTSRSTG